MKWSIKLVHIPSAISLLLSSYGWSLDNTDIVQCMNSSLGGHCAELDQEPSGSLVLQVVTVRCKLNTLSCIFLWFVSDMPIFLERMRDYHSMQCRHQLSAWVYCTAALTGKFFYCCLLFLKIMGSFSAYVVLICFHFLYRKRWEVLSNCKLFRRQSKVCFEECYLGAYTEL